jgi:hypothetical protein
MVCWKPSKQNILAGAGVRDHSPIHTVEGKRPRPSDPLFLIRRKIMQKKNHAQNGAAAGHNGGLLQMIPLGDIEPSPNNPRQHFDDKKFAELVASIKQNGIAQPILVRPINGAKSEKAKFQIVAGERRYRASDQLGLKDTPAYIKTLSDGRLPTRGW